jgi:hypothetical protein
MVKNIVKNKKGGTFFSTSLKKSYKSSQKTLKNKINKINTKHTITKMPPSSIFVPTEGEDTIESNLSFLIAMMGGSLYDIYVERILNVRSGQQIQVKQVKKSSYESNLYGITGPTIFYGKENATHFTCTVDGSYLWDSYNEGFQKRNTNHFCQTFALMYMEHSFLPEGYIGQEYLKLQKGEFFDNAMIAKNVACSILNELLQMPDIFREHDDFYYYFDSELNKKTLGVSNHRINSEIKLKPHGEDELFFYNPKLVSKFILYCQNLTKADICTSSFRQQIDLS